METPLWQPSAEAAARTQLAHFRARAEVRAGRALPDSGALHAWSIEDRAAFWRLVWDFCDVVGEPGDCALEDGERMPGARWFPQARLNFAENLLRARSGDDERPALISRGERGERRELSWRELRTRSAHFAASLRGLGVAPGQRVAAILPNLPETVIAMLGSASAGATFSSCSPDFGAQGVLDRFGQIEPSVLLVTDGYVYNGRVFETADRLAQIIAGLPSVEHVVLVPCAGDSAGARRALPGLLDFEALSSGSAPPAFDFERLPFDHPLYVMYSSGTTGKPKCIVHGAGGTLLKHLQEQRLHVDLRAGERLFYFTTCGWMMWNWLVSGLASGAALVLYDGSPFHPESAVFDLAQAEGLDVLGVSAKYLDAAAKAGLEPKRTHDLSSLRLVLSTGSPLAPEGFDYVYERVAPQVQLASISGGTDLMGCFVLGDPTRPVWRGEIQAPALGMAVEVFDDAGRPARDGIGELVCTRAFPSMPIGFWNDPDGARYRAAYFERFPGVWCHGDWTRVTEHGGYVIQGRSDAVLNPGGVRIGTAEIYRQVERLAEVTEAIAVGQRWEGDVRIVLFVVLREGVQLDDTLRERIRSTIRSGASPRHVPARVLAVPDIPRTRSGKITELAVRAVVHGEPVRNVEALANPEALDHFRNRAELAS